jgi:hypothetical protein
MALTQQQKLMYQPIETHIERFMPLFKKISAPAFPPVIEFNNDLNIINDNKKPLSFIEQNNNLPFPELGYEERIYYEGLIATRKSHWHDFFNALVWHTFPQIKSAINAIHVQELKLQKNSLRSRKRDLLTLFDESGFIIIADNTILELIRQHAWNELFVKRKRDWIDGKITLITFGHALYEKYLNPYIGMTAQALLLSSKQNDLDSSLAIKLLNGNLLQSKSELSPLPLLGIPGWHKTQDDDFYANTSYFR